jgi:hypothetical protein
MPSFTGLRLITNRLPTTDVMGSEVAGKLFWHNYSGFTPCLKFLGARPARKSPLTIYEQFSQGVSFVAEIAHPRFVK